ncbi:MAG: hypothetical protein FWE44_03395 [Defluviitaleaceae bacterium]|nr:hypothetical protein [Defluviitaleaceae bacterium]
MEHQEKSQICASCGCSGGCNAAKDDTNYSDQNGLKALGSIFFLSSLFITYIVFDVLQIGNAFFLFLWFFSWMTYNIILTKKGKSKLAKWLAWGFYILALFSFSYFWIFHQQINATFFIAFWFVFNLTHMFMRDKDEKRRTKGTKWSIYWTILAVFYVVDLNTDFSHILLAYIAIWLIDEVIDYRTFRKQKA